VKFTDVQHRHDIRENDRNTKLAVTHTGVRVKPSLANSGVLTLLEDGQNRRLKKALYAFGY